MLVNKEQVEGKNIATDLPSILSGRRGKLNDDDMKKLREQGFDVDDDNLPNPENVSEPTPVGSIKFSGFGQFLSLTSKPCSRSFFISSSFNFPFRPDKIEGRSVALFSPSTCSSFNRALTY